MARDWYGRSGPRRVAKDGIAATKKRGAAYTWWSDRFVAVLESFGAGTRLQRGRSYARTGQVMNLVVAPGLVTADVQGSRPRPYHVRIAITVLTPAQWTAVDDALASQALFAAALLAGEMPAEIEDVFRGAGHPLFPTRARDIQSTCTCPDAANPCKHVAATYYVLAERFDADPFAILAWRGRERDALIATLRARRAEAPTDAPVPAPEPDPDAPIDPATFWDAAPETLALRFPPDPDAPADALARRLGPLRSGGVDLAAALGPAWTAIAAGARRRGSD